MLKSIIGDRHVSSFYFLFQVRPVGIICADKHYQSSLVGLFMNTCVNFMNSCIIFIFGRS